MTIVILEPELERIAGDFPGSKSCPGRQIISMGQAALDGCSNRVGWRAGHEKQGAALPAQAPPRLMSGCDVACRLAFSSRGIGGLALQYFQWRRLGADQMPRAQRRLTGRLIHDGLGELRPRWGRLQLGGDLKAHPFQLLEDCIADELTAITVACRPRRLVQFTQKGLIHRKIQQSLAWCPLIRHTRHIHPCNFFATFRLTGCLN